MMNDTKDAPDTLKPAEGWHVVHLFYSVQRELWQELSHQQRHQARNSLAQTVEDIRAWPDTQLLCFAMLTPKADVGFMLLTPDLHDACQLEKRLSIALGPGLLEPVYSYLSLTERSEYTTTEEQHRQSLIKEEGLAEDSPELAAKLAEFTARMEKYLGDRLYPNLPTPHEWPVFCFYPMNKRRLGSDNWYALDFESRRELMAGHARIGRTWHGKIRQLITGSTGLDTWEWGVTLFAKDSADIKGIVYQMRFDEVSARYAEFGDFYIGIHTSLPQVLERIEL
jgi:hydrogen peroxide-dependent heme synthase